MPEALYELRPLRGILRMHLYAQRDTTPVYSHPIRFLIYPQPILAGLGLDPRGFSHRGEDLDEKKSSDLLDFSRMAREIPQKDLWEWSFFHLIHDLNHSGKEEYFPAYNQNASYFNGNRCAGRPSAIYGDLTEDNRFTSAFTRETGLTLLGNINKNELDVDFFDLIGHLTSHFNKNWAADPHPSSQPDTFFNRKSFFSYMIGPHSYPVGNESMDSWVVSFIVKHVGVVDDTHVIGLFPYPEISSDAYVDGVSVQENQHPKGRFFRQLYEVLRGMSIPAHAIVDRGLMDGYMYQQRLNGMVASQVR